MQLKISNFEIIESAEINISGITVVVGATHAGKSSVVRAVESLLYGAPGDEYIRRGSSFCTVSMNDGKSIIRTRDAKGAVYFDGKKHEKLGRTSHRDLLEPWGITEFSEQVSFRPNMIRQFDTLFLMAHTPSEAFYLLSLIFEESRYSKVLKNVASEIKAQNVKLVGLTSLIEHTESEIERNTSTCTRIEEILARVGPSIEKRVKSLDRVKQAEKSLEGHQITVLAVQKAKADTLRKFPESGDAVLKSIKLVADKKKSCEQHASILFYIQNQTAFAKTRKDLVSKLTQCEQSLHLLLKKIRLAEMYRSSAAEIDKVNPSLIDSYKVLIRRITDSTDTVLKITSSTKVYKEFQTSFDKVSSEESSTKRLSESLKEVNKDLNECKASINTCPHCGSHLTDDTKATLLAKG